MNLQNKTIEFKIRARNKSKTNKNTDKFIKDKKRIVKIKDDFSDSLVNLIKFEENQIRFKNINRIHKKTNEI